MKHFLIIVTFLLISTPVLPGDFPMYVEQFLKSFENQYVKLEPDKNFIKQLDSNESFWSVKFMLKSKTAHVNKYEQKVYQRLYVSFYWYQDTLKAERDLLKLLEKFEMTKTQIKEQQDISSLKSTPVMVWFGFGKLAVIHIPCEHIDERYVIAKQKLNDILKQDFRFLLDVGCGGPLKWNSILKSEDL